MSGPPPGEQERGRKIGRFVKIGARTALFVGLAVKASAGLSEGVTQPLNPQVGNDRGGGYSQDDGRSQTTLGGHGDGGKNPRIDKSQGKASGVLASVDAGSSLPSTPDGNYIKGNDRPDTGSSQVVFKNTRGGKNIGPASDRIAKDNATARGDWSASSGNTLNIPRAPANIEVIPLQYDPPDWMNNLSGSGVQLLEALLGGGPILAACAPIMPSVLPRASETRVPTKAPTPTLSPIAEFSEQPVATELVARLEGRVPDTEYISERDLAFITKYMESQGRVLSGIVGSNKAQDYAVKMPVMRDLLQRWTQGIAEPVSYIEKIDTGEKYDLIPVGKIGSDVVVYSMVKIPADSTIVRFVNPDGSLSLPARILKGNGSNDSVLGVPQGDRIWFGGLGMYYDGSLLPPDAQDTTDYLRQNASAIARFAQERYQWVIGGKLLIEDELKLNILPFHASDGTTHSLIKEEAGSGSAEYYVLNLLGGFAHLQEPPTGMRRQFDKESGKFVYERQGPYADDPWYVIARFDPDGNNGFGAIVNIAAPATSTPTLAPSPIPTVAPTETLAPTVIPTEVPKPIHTWTGPASLETSGQISWNDIRWTSIKDNGGARAELINDSDIGPAIKYIVTQDRKEGNDFRYYLEKKGVPDPNNPNIGPVNWNFEWSVKISSGYLVTADGQSVSLGSVFDKIGDTDGNFRVIAGIDVYKDGRPRISVKDPNTGAELIAFRSSRSLRPDVAYKISFLTKGDMITLLIDGDVWATGKLPAEFVGAFPKDFHAGAYGHGSKVDSYIINGPVKATITK